LKWTKAGFEHLQSKGIEFGVWPGRDNLARFVFGHSTSDAEVDVLTEALNDSKHI